ncbi:hypothetical protein TWF718_009990 [Orbilia javanica]|uniref:Uncharacterized protein n=1 Tax=Orbilia javanica TaxID=47235 RepID=A0AAN8MUH9_9PEZI
MPFNIKYCQAQTDNRLVNGIIQFRASKAAQSADFRSPTAAAAAPRLMAPILTEPALATVDK